MFHRFSRIACLLHQLPPGCLLRPLALVDDACGDLPDRLSDARPEVLEQQDFALASDEADYRGRARMLHDFPLRLLRRRKDDLVPPDVEYLSLVDQFRGDYSLMLYQTSSQDGGSFQVFSRVSQSELWHRVTRGNYWGNLIEIS